MTQSYKRLFQRAIAAAPDRLHFAAHSHHLWPDASYVGQIAAWEDGVRLADRKWERVMGEIWPAAQRHVADELNLPDPNTVVFAGNTHDFLTRIVSAMDRPHPIRILTTDGEFHSFRRQAARWEEAGVAVIERLPVTGDIDDRLVQRARERAAAGDVDLIFVSQVMFNSGFRFSALDALGDIARPDGPWVVIDGYHGFMAIPEDLEAASRHIFYLAGGYKYAMSGEGVALMHAPPGFGPRPELTGWYAEFDDLARAPGTIGYAPDARRFLGSTFDPSGLYRFVAVRDMLAEEGITTRVVQSHVAALRDQLLDGLVRTPLAGAERIKSLYSGPPPRFLAFRDPRAAAWQAALQAQDVITDVRGDVLRIGFGLYQDARDVEGLLAELAHLPA